MPSWLLRISLWAPDQLPGLRVERERVRRGGAVDAAVAVGDAVRPDARLVEAVAPLELAGRAVEREDVRVQVLEIDRAVEGRSESTRRRRTRLAPLNGKRHFTFRLRDRLRVDRRLGRGARVREVVVVRRPRAGVGRPLGRRLAQGRRVAGGRRAADQAHDGKRRYERADEGERRPPGQTCSDVLRQ